MKVTMLTVLVALLLAVQVFPQQKRWEQAGRPGSRGILDWSKLDTEFSLDGDGKPEVSLLLPAVQKIRNQAVGSQAGLNIDSALVVIDIANSNEQWRFPLTGTTQSLAGIELIGFFDVRQEPGKEAVLGKRTPKGIIAILIGVVDVGIVHEFDEKWRLAGAGNLDGEPGDELMFYDPANDKIEIWGK